MDSIEQLESLCKLKDEIEAKQIETAVLVLKEYGITKLGLWNEEFIDTYEEDVNSTRRMPNSLGRSNLISTWILTRAGMKMSAQAAFLR